MELFNKIGAGEPSVSEVLLLSNEHGLNLQR